MAVKRNCISVPIEVFAGHIREAVSQGIALARKIDCPVHMKFNATHVAMYQDSEVEAVIRDYDSRFGHMEEEAQAPSSLCDDLRSALEAYGDWYERLKKEGDSGHGMIPPRITDSLMERLIEVDEMGRKALRSRS